ncbi:MAG: DNA/RNA non-specific endonuclease [Pyrinomonadaceae bacterium]
MTFFRNNLILFLLLSFAFGAASCQRFTEQTNNVPTPDTKDARSAQATLLPFGNPSNASTDPDNYLLTHRSHVLSYNNSRGTLNWIAWRTTAADLGEKRERSRFEEDRSLPNGFRRVQYYDYSGSGYDRGHVVPAADRFADESLMEETFLMTNIVPQTGDLNQFPWNKLEMYARGIARNGSELYTIAGVYGEKGRLRGKVTVPTNCWKVIVVLPRGQTTITKTSRIIAVDMPNIDGIENENWQKYQTTVRDIEQKTGLDLFSAIPRDIQDTIEAKQMIASP